MKELTLNEVKEVSGAYDYGGVIGAGLGSGFGSAWGVNAGARFGAWAGPLGAIGGAFIGSGIQNMIVYYHSEEIAEKGRRDARNIGKRFWQDQRDGIPWYGPY